MANTNAQMIANYNKAIAKLTQTLSRQQLAAEATQGQIDGFRALVAQLEKQK